jgi:hypothetical protein
MVRMTNTVIRPAWAKYNDPEFTDIEVEVLLKYFGLPRYHDLLCKLQEMKNRHLEAC